MQRLVIASFVIVLFGLVTLWAGCGGGGGEVEPRQQPEKPETPTPPELKGIPDWFLNVPTHPDYLYATGTHKCIELGEALVQATGLARVEIANQIETKVMGLFKRFREEVGVGEDAQLTAETIAVSKAVVSESLKLSRLSKQHLEMDGIEYRMYVLVDMPIGLAKTKLLSKIKENSNMYTRFRASQAFEELEEEVKKYKQSRKEQGQ